MKNKIKTILQKDHTLGVDEIKEISNNPFHLIDTGYEYVELGQYEKALTLFNIGLGIDDSDVEILNGLGIALSELDKLEEAIIVLKRALRLNPNDTITMANLASVYWQMGDLDKAIHYYNNAIQLETPIEELYSNIINIYLDAGYFAMAYSNCIEYLKYYPDNPEANELLAETMISLALTSN